MPDRLKIGNQDEEESDSTKEQSEWNPASIEDFSFFGSKNYFAQFSSQQDMDSYDNSISTMKNYLYSCNMCCVYGFWIGCSRKSKNCDRNVSTNNSLLPLNKLSIAGKKNGDEEKARRKIFSVSAEIFMTIKYDAQPSWTNLMIFIEGQKKLDASVYERWFKQLFPCIGVTWISATHTHTHAGS